MFYFLRTKDLTELAASARPLSCSARPMPLAFPGLVALLQAVLASPYPSLTGLKQFVSPSMVPHLASVHLPLFPPPSSQHL